METGAGPPGAEPDIRIGRDGRESKKLPREPGQPSKEKEEAAGGQQEECGPTLHGVCEKEGVG